jgi:hypothetical protein
MICEVSYNELLLVLSSAAFSFFPLHPAFCHSKASSLGIHSSALNLERRVPTILMKGKFVDVKCGLKRCLMT